MTTVIAAEKTLWQASYCKRGGGMSQGEAPRFSKEFLLPGKDEKLQQERQALCGQIAKAVELYRQAKEKLAAGTADEDVIERLVQQAQSAAHSAIVETTYGYGYEFTVTEVDDEERPVLHLVTDVRSINEESLQFYNKQSGEWLDIDSRRFRTIEPNQ